jgi:D-alanine-D-alanine ligase
MASVLVLCGGDNSERLVSLASGDAVSNGLIAAGHEVFKIDTAKPNEIIEGNVLFLNGPVGIAPPEELESIKFDIDNLHKLLTSIRSLEIDVIFPILHGSWGEDGHIQALFELIDIPYLGSKMLPSALAMDKQATKNIALRSGIEVPSGFLAKPGDNLKELYNECKTGRYGFELNSEHPVVIKPNSGGSSAGICITDNEEKFIKGIELIWSMGEIALIENFIEGREITVPLIDGIPLAVIEIAPKDGFYDYTNKYTSGKTEYLCPAPIEEKVATEAQSLSKIIHDALGCRHLARVDWRLTTDNQLSFLEVNVIPGMTDLSLVPMSAKECGVDFPALMDKFVKMSLLDD